MSGTATEIKKRRIGLKRSQRLRLWMPVGALLTDWISMIVGGILAYYIRFHPFFLQWIPAVEVFPRLRFYIALVIVVGTVSIVLFLFRGLYRYPLSGRFVDELGRVLVNFLFAHALVLAVIFFYRGFSYSRLTVGIGLILGAVGLVLSRTMWHFIRLAAYKRGFAAKRAALVLEKTLPDAVLRVFSHLPRYGIQLVGCLEHRFSSDAFVPSLGSIDEVRDVVKRENIEVLIVISSDEKGLRDLIRCLYGLNIEFFWLPDPHLVMGLPRRLVEMGGLPFWALKDVPFRGWSGVIKRIFDLTFATLSLIVLFPLFLIIGVLVKITSPGPVFYRQQRVGLDGKIFSCLKFRSMRTDAEVQGKPGWTKPGDPRVTPLGKLLRRFSLDELPQLINVIKGEMSLVGPRPERPEWVEQFAHQWEDYHERHRVKVGITGWAQVNGLRGDSSIEERLRYDKFYVENWSLWFDIKILLLTILAVIKGENAY